MTTPRKRWPNEACWARDAAAEAMNDSIALLRPLLDHDDLEVVAKAGKVIMALSTSLRALERVGAEAPIFPDTSSS
jgi:hypothetical protein